MVLKRIPPSQVELGMYIHAFHGNWLSHPFWRAHFLVDDERLEDLRSSAVTGLVIDTDRGIDVADEDDALAPAAAGSPPRSLAALRMAQRTAAVPVVALAAMPAQRSPPAPQSGPLPIAREFGNARIAAGKARKVISKVFLEARLGKAPRVVDVAPVVEDIYASIQRNPYAFSGLMRCKADSEIAYHHMLSVSALMVSLARQMRLPPGETRLAGMAGLLLDIGVSCIDIDLAAQAGRFDEIDPELWHRHCYAGRDLLAAAGELPDEVPQVVLRHHERLDGTGFPQGLGGQDLDVFSRMAAVCDSYDHIVAGAVTGQSVDPAEAMRMLMDMEGALDPEILARFREALGVYPVGSFVILRSQRVAMVVDQDPADAALPTVRAFYSLATGKHVAARTIALAQCWGEDAIVGVADLEALGLPAAQDLRERLLGIAVRSASTTARTG